MYEDYFGLDRSPFKITPDTSLFYEGGKRGDILAALVYAIHRGEGIIKVVGEVGSGKTMLCRMLQLKLPESVEIVYIANPSVSPDDILFVIAHELRLSVDKSASKHEVMHLLQDYLLQRHMEDKQVVLFVEEAQGMPIETLEEIRLLSNLETDQHKLLQIILFGQPELDVNLARQEIRQLRERITHHFNLEPLTDDEIHRYLNFRMREVGYTGPELISKSLARRVAQHSEGLLRRINIIADKILLSAFADGTHNLSAKHVMAAVKDSTFHEEVKSDRGKMWLLFAFLLLLALAYAVYQARGQWMNTQAAVVPSEQATQSPADISAVTNDPQPEQSSVAAQALAQPRTPENAAASAGDSVMPERQPIEVAAVQANVAAIPSNQPLAGAAESVGAIRSATEAETEVLKKALSQSASQKNLLSQQNPPSDLTPDYQQWLNAKMQDSLQWLSNAERDNVSIQVLMRSKNATEGLVYYLRNEWPLDLAKTYVYEVNKDGKSIYRVFFDDFDSMTEAQQVLKSLPDSVKVNSPYLHSVYRMQEALL